MTTSRSTTTKHFTPPKPAPPAPEQTDSVAAMSGDKRQDELNTKIANYQAKPAPDNQTRLDIAHIVSVATDEVAVISGSRGGHQQPRKTP
jgi:hypothetical protein